MNAKKWVHRVLPVLVLALVVLVAPVAAVVTSGNRCPCLRDIWSANQLLAFDADVDGDGTVTWQDLDLVVAYSERPFEAGNIASLRSDCNMDRMVNETDIEIVSSAFGLQSPISWRRVDANGSGVVDAQDLEIMRGWLGTNLQGNPVSAYCNVNFVDLPGQQYVGTMDLCIMLSMQRLPIPTNLLPNSSKGVGQKTPQIAPPGVLQ